MHDLWTYDSANRALVDENGLRVAREVGPQDAALILSARAGLHKIAGDAASVYDVRDAKKALDGGYAPDPLDAHATAPTPPAARARPLWLVLDQMLRWNADAFDDDAEVNGGDLVEAFSGWREEIKAALAASPAFNAWDKGYQDGFADGVADHDGPGVAEIALAGWPTKLESR